MNESHSHPDRERGGRLWSRLLRFGLLPVLIYLAGFAAITYPAVRQFNSHFFTDPGDGLQNVWNIWWMSEAVTRLHCSPWYTTYLFHPEGTTLLGHTLNPFNGFLCIPLLRFMSLVQAHNAVVLFSFVATGVTGFLLAFYFTRAYWPSVLAGALVTFSPFHVAHANGHLQLVSLEWVPLFLLCWFHLLHKPRVRTGVAAALVLALVLLCDYYYFFYCVLAGLLILLWYLIKHRRSVWREWRPRLGSLLAFAGAALVTCGPIPLLLIREHGRDPFVGAHHTQSMSADAVAPFIPGGRWRLKGLTSFYWERLAGNLDETAVHLGLSVVCVLVFVLIWNRRRRPAWVGMWFLVMVVFFLLSLGPVLHVWGTAVPFQRIQFGGLDLPPPPMPYELLERVFPLVALSGVPVRMMVMVTLGASVLCAYGFAGLGRGRGRLRWALPGVLLAGIIVEHLPDPFETTPAQWPAYVDALRDLPDGGAVVDLHSRPGKALYYQTIHRKPLAFAYVSRVQTGVHSRQARFQQLAEAGAYDEIRRDPEVGYLIVPADAVYASGRPLYEDAEVRIYGGAGAATSTGR